MVNIAGLDKAKVLAALYNNAKPQGLGLIHYQAGDMSEEEAAELVEAYGDRRFDYLKGRVIKTRITGDELDPDLYDRDNGQGAMERVISSLR